MVIITAFTPESSFILETALQIKSEVEDIMFEDVLLRNSLDVALKVNNNNNYTLLNTITNNPLVLKYSLKDLLDWVKESYLERDINLVYKFIFDTGASVYVICNKL